MDFAKPHQNERMADKPLSGPHRTSRRSADEIDVTSFDILPVAITSEGFGLCRGLGEKFRYGEVALLHSRNVPK
jgi:hypothetical protein